MISADLATLYEQSVGHNANLLLDFSPQYSGELPPESVAAYAAFGDWVYACYGPTNRLNSTAAADPPPQAGVGTHGQCNLQDVAGWGALQKCRQVGITSQLKTEPKTSLEPLAQQSAA